MLWQHGRAEFITVLYCISILLWQEPYWSIHRLPPQILCFAFLFFPSLLWFRSSRDTKRRGWWVSKLLHRWILLPPFLTAIHFNSITKRSFTTSEQSVVFAKRYAVFAYSDAKRQRFWARRRWPEYQKLFAWSCIDEFFILQVIHPLGISRK